MDNQDDVISNALKLEDNKFMQFVSDATRQREYDLSASAQDMASRGLGNSGAKLKAEVDIIFASVEKVVERAIAYRQELGTRAPVLLEDDYLKGLKDKLDRYVDGAANGARRRPMPQASPPAVDALTREAEQKVRSIKAMLRQRLSALPLEAKLGMHQNGESTVTNIHIAHSVVAGLNLGSVMGDLSNSIQQINSGGHNELGSRLARMTEAVAESNGLDDPTRRDVIEHLAVVSEETSRPPEKRKLGPLKTSIGAIRSGIGTTVQLVEIWQAVEHALRAAGIL